MKSKAPWLSESLSHDELPTYLPVGKSKSYTDDYLLLKFHVERQKKTGYMHINGEMMQ